MVLAMAERTPNRSERTTRELIAYVCQFLRRSLSNDDYAAMVSRGYRPADWEPDASWIYNPAEPCRDHRREFCAPCSPRPHPRETPRCESEIDRNVDWAAEHYARGFRAGVKTALAVLPWRERMAVQFHCIERLSFEHIEAWRPRFGGKSLAGSDTTIWRLHDAGLERMVDQLFDRTGAVRQ